MEMNEDHQLQEDTEGGASSVTREGRAYRMVFDALRREPDFVLPPSFAARVVGQLQQSRSSREMTWLVVGLLSIVMAMLVAIGMTGFRPDVGMFTFISNYPGFISFGVAFILFLHWIDRKYVVRRPT